MEMVKFESNWLELLGIGILDPIQPNHFIEYGKNRHNE